MQCGSVPFFFIFLFLFSKNVYGTGEHAGHAGVCVCVPSEAATLKIV